MDKMASKAIITKSIFMILYTLFALIIRGCMNFIPDLTLTMSKGAVITKLTTASFSPKFTNLERES